MAIKMQIRRGTLTAWASADPTLVAGELGFVTDAGKTAFKIGDGTNTWTTLPYVNSTYPELLPDAGGNLDLATVQGRYQLLSGATYAPVPATDFTNTTTDGNCLLLVTVPSTTIVIQELTTSLTTCKRFIRAKNNSTWTAWKRIDNLTSGESLSITNLTLTGKLFVPPGSAAAPSITITGDTTTGIYQFAAQQLGIATNGVNRVRVGDTLTTVTTGLTVSSTLTASNGLTVSTGTITLPAGSVAGAAIATSGITATQLAAGSVTRTKLSSIPQITIASYYSGSGTFVVPTGVIALKVVAWGGGGGGAQDVTGGNGGEGYGGIAIYSVTPGASYAYSVGAGGAGAANGTNNTPGTAGGNTTFLSMTAGGGAGGSGQTNGANGSYTITTAPAGTAILADYRGGFGSNPLIRARAVGATAGLVFAPGATLPPGSFGTGSVNNGSNGTNAATGGVGGMLIIEYIDMA